MSKKVNFNNFASEVMKITKDYAQEVEDESAKVVMETAFEAEEQLHVAGSFKNGKRANIEKVGQLLSIKLVTVWKPLSITKYICLRIC